MSRSAALSLVFALEACSPAPRPVATRVPSPPSPRAAELSPSTPSAPVPSATTQPSDSAPAASASSAEPLAPPSYGPDPSLADANDRAKLAIAKAICPAAIGHDGSAIRVGCRACPPFDDAKPDGTVAIDPPHLWPIEVVVAGSFSRPGADEVAVVMQGCESHADDDGGTILAERSGTSWKLVSYASGVHPREAKALRTASGRDLLIYLYADAHQTTGTDALFAYDFRLGEDDPERGMRLLVEVTRNAASACVGLTPDLGLVRGEIASFDVTPARAARKAGLTVRVRHASAPWSAALQGRVDAACKTASTNPDEIPVIDPAPFTGPLAAYTLSFALDGERLVPDAATLRTMKRLGIAPGGG